MAALNDWLKGISIHALREEGDRLWGTDTVGRL